MQFPLQFEKQCVQKKKFTLFKAHFPNACITLGLLISHQSWQQLRLFNIYYYIRFLKQRLIMKWRVRPTRCNKLWFINNPLAQHVWSIIMPIFRSARPYVTAYGFSALDVLAGVLGIREAGRVHCAHGLLPGFPRFQPAHLVLKNHMQ